jgi:hypothetical protein
VSLTGSDGGEHQGEMIALSALNTKVPAPIEHPNGSTAAGAVGVDHIKSVFRSLEPDLYQLRVQLADGQWSDRLVSIRDEKPRELTIVCPSPRTKRAPVSMTIKPLPDWMQKKGFKIAVEVQPAPMEIGQAKWATASQPTQSITFDAQSGLPVAITAMTSRGAPELDLRDLPAEERRVFLPVGAVVYWFEVNEQPVLGSVPCINGRSLPRRKAGFSTSSRPMRITGSWSCRRSSWTRLHATSARANLLLRSIFRRAIQCRTTRLIPRATARDRLNLFPRQTLPNIARF